MNERIKELAEQAWVYQVRVLNEPDGSRTYTQKEKVFDKEKFAELIVRECVDIALEQKQWVEDQEVFNPQDEQWNRARIQQSQRIVDKIKEHFGVEE